MNLLVVTPEEKSKIRKYYNVQETQIQENVELIKVWLSKQAHLPQNLTDDFIEKLLLRNKFRIETTKQKLDNYYSLRGSNRELIQDFQNIVPSKHVSAYLPLPNLTPNLERVILMKFIITDPDLYDVYDLVRIDLAITELMLQYDYAIGIRFVFDFDGVTLKHLIKANPELFKKLMNLFQQAYSCRILGMEFLNCPSFANKIMALVKLIVKPKIYERVKIHDDLESFHKTVPKECLPAEYGGTMSNFPDLLKQWDQVMVDHHDFFVENYDNVSQEHLRAPENYANEAFGVEGTFRKLAID